MVSRVVKWRWELSSSALLCVLLASGAWAQSSNSDLAQSCGSNPPSEQTLYTITTQADADNITHCTTFNGSVAVQPNSGITNITLSGITHISNDLIVGDATDLSSFSAPSLQLIDGNLSLENCSTLTDIQFPALQQTGLISITDLPNLASLPFTSNNSTGTTAAGAAETNLNTTALQIVNTSLSSLSINLPDRIEGINITNNPNLTNITITGMSLLLDILEIDTNAANAEIFLPDLSTSIAPLLLGNISRIEMPALSESGVLAFAGFTGQSFEFDQLTQAEGLLLNDNPGIMEVTLPALSVVGGIIVTDNPNLVSMAMGNLSSLLISPGLEYVWFASGNPNLEVLEWSTLGEVAGDVSLTGNFSRIDTPQIHFLGSTFNLTSTNPSFNCSTFDAMPFDRFAHAYGQPSSSYSCSAIAPGSSTDTAIHDTSLPLPSSSSGLSSGAKAGLGVGLGLGIPILIAVGVWAYLRGRRRRLARERIAAGMANGDGNDAEGTQLRDLGPGGAGAAGQTVRGTQRDDLLDGLPGYRAAGLPGEVPPQYGFGFEKEGGGFGLNGGQEEGRREFGAGGEGEREGDGRVGRSET